MSVKYDTIEEIKAKIERMDEEIKADRASRGVPPDPPPKFVDEDVAYALIRKCGQAERLIIRYAILCDEQNDIISLTDEQTKWLEDYALYANLIRESMEPGFVSYGIGLQEALHLMLAGDDYKYKKEAEVYTGRLFQSAQLMQLTHDLYNINTKKYNVLTDDELTKKVGEYLLHYESIKDQY